ncbi:RNA polymerase sigma factor [Streptomyces sp. NPDC092296]|uniref:RNA polymerase sigma factor n=1 Tax=Streptomyces sp. NPDC092296 TaxID=3366012 RepID=UPI00380A9552
MATAVPVRWDHRIRERLALGEEAALGELYDQFAPLVHGLANRVLDSQEDAEQITREVFGHIWEHPEEFDPAQGSLRSWIGTLTHRRAVDRLRRHSGLPPVGDRTAADPAVTADPDATDPDATDPDATDAADPCTADTAPEPYGVEARVLAAATAARVQYVLTSLPHPLRETLTLTYFGGRSYPQAARELGVSEATAKHRMRLGLQLLATALAMEGGR